MLAMRTKDKPREIRHEDLVARLWKRDIGSKKGALGMEVKA
ncbi:hypothetical protein LCGC14_0480790 [marine sediment metagenome]|uniref:Uncharacterized protein n=1 Tax=marine sediment metagenome TaxID=412755 RepID=A0A0F9S9A1_9ZZZZ